MKYCFLYPGQGAQYPGMGKELWENSQKVKDLFTLASDIMGRDMTSLLFDGPEEDLKLTCNTQPAIILVSTAVKTVLEDRGIRSSGCAGFSVGEFAALEDAGLITVEQLFNLIKIRGALMHKAGETLGSGDNAPGMAAVIGLSVEKIEELFGDGTLGVYPANFNAPTQIVLAGTAEGLAKAEEICKENGARRYIPLKVSAPFHSPLLEDARKEFQETLAGYSFKDPVKTIYSNVTGNVITSGEEAKKLAVDQVINPVRWTLEEANVLKDAYDVILETGPGKVLTGLWKSFTSDSVCLPCETLDQINAVTAVK